MNDATKLDKIDYIFKLLDDWRKLPSYQLERRADIYFACYLPEIMMDFLSKEDDVGQNKINLENIIPEFPLKKSDCISGEKNYTSTKVDYAVFTQSKLYLVELKTTWKSLKAKQVDEAVKRFKGVPENNTMTEEEPEKAIDLVRDICVIRHSPNSDSKYKNLIDRLSGVPGIKKIKANMKRSDNPEKAISGVEVSQRDIEILYILPRKPGELKNGEFKENRKYTSIEKKIYNYKKAGYIHVITFADIMAVLDKIKETDCLANSFYSVLEDWQFEPE